MNVFSKLMAVALTVLVCGCTSTPNIESDYTTEFDFAALKNYYLIPANDKTYQEQAGTSLDEQRVEAAINQTLQGRGLAPVSKEQADVLVSYHLTTKDRTRIHSYHANFRYHARYRKHHWAVIGPNNVDVDQFTEGQLLIDLVDPKANQVVFRGLSKKRLRKASAEEKNADTQRYVDAMLAEVPGW